jgi:hypothetical protein
MMSSRAGLLLGTFGLAAVAALVACSGAQGMAGASDSASTEDEGLSILFPQMYSTFDGERTFKVPAKVDGVKKVKWSAEDPDMVDFDTQTDGSVLITVRKAGSTKIVAKAGGLVGKAPLEVTEAGADDWKNGNERYNNGVTWKRGGGGDAGGGGRRGAPDPNLACTNCHAAGKTDPVQHTPMQTAGYTDDEIIAIFTKGKKPDGVAQRIMPLEKWSKLHQWTMEPEETKGLVVYLRSLEPKSQGPVDFGGRGARGGKDGSSSSSSSGGTSSGATSSSSSSSSSGSPQ